MATFPMMISKERYLWSPSRHWHTKSIQASRSSAKFLKQLSLEVAIVTNQLGKVYPNVKWNLTMIAKVPFFATYDHYGIIASFTDDGRIVLTDRIHDY